MRNFDQDILALLQGHLAMLDKSVAHLQYTFAKCKDISLDEDLDDNQLELLDSLASRFARTSELLTKQVIRTIFQLLEEYPKVVIDQVNRAEALNLISSADEILKIRKVRNQVVHEYTEEEWISLYNEIKLLVPRLLVSVELTKAFVDATFDRNPS